MPTVPYPSGGLPRLVTQLGTGSPTAGDDCGAVAPVNAVLLLSGGKVGPQDPSEDKDWVALMRGLGHNITGPMLVRGDTTEALNSPTLDKAFKSAGLPGIVATYYHHLSWNAMKQHLRKRHVVLLAVKHSVLIAGKAPVGSLTFQGGHLLALAGLRNVGGRVWVNDGDSLFDGRAIPGPTPGRYPDGYQEARLPEFRKAAARFGTKPPGLGKATCIVVKGGLHP